MSAHRGRHLLSSPVMRGAVIYFGIVFGAGFLLGAVRIPFLVPRFGVRIAELAEMPLMFLVIFLAAGYVVRKYGSSIFALGWLLVGGMALALLVAAELLFAVALVGRGLEEYVASRDPVSGAVYLVMLVVFAGMPWLRRGLAIGRPTGRSHVV